MNKELLRKKQLFEAAAKTLTMQAEYKDWNELKTKRNALRLEEARLALPLPTSLPNPFPATFSFEDYTNEAIDAINKRGRYLTMDELSRISPPTAEMQDAIKDSIKTGKVGGVIGAPAGFGKSYTFKYLGIMAAERSLSHDFLWFRGGVLTDPSQLRTSSSVSEYHFMFTDARNLSQTGGLLGGSVGPLRDLRENAVKYSGRFILCLDELYTALSQETDAAGGWFALKGLTEPEPLVKIIGTMATKDVKAFKSLKVSQITSPGSRESIQKPVYDGQMKSRFHFKDVPDYTDAEQQKTLRMGGLDAITHNKEAQLFIDYAPQDKDKIISSLIVKTNDVERGVAPENREWAAPRKWKAIISEAFAEVEERVKEFSEYKADIDYIKKTEDLSRWYDVIKNLEAEKSNIQKGIQTKNPAAPAAPGQSEDVGIISLRDIGNKFPHEEVESEGSVVEQKKERLNSIQEKENEVKAELAAIKRRRRYAEIAYKQGVSKLNQIYGDGVFAPDMSDLGMLKPRDIDLVDITKIRLEEESA
jgi:hypothetical protein